MNSWFSRPSKKEQLVQLFSEHVSPELLDSVAAPDFSKINELSQGPVEFILAAVQGASPNETGERLGSVATIARQSGWMIQNLLCNLAVFVHGTLPIKEPLVLDRSALANKLLQSSPSNIKIVHGVEAAFFGNMGGSARITYGVLLPSFLEAMSRLNALPFGRAQEIVANPSINTDAAR